MLIVIKIEFQCKKAESNRGGYENTAAALLTNFESIHQTVYHHFQ